MLKKPKEDMKEIKKMMYEQNENNNKENTKKKKIYPGAKKYNN